MKVIPRRKRHDEKRTGTMTVVEHVEELRHRIIISLYAVAAGAVVGWFLFHPFHNLIENQYSRHITTHPAQAPPPRCDLLFSAALDAMVDKIKVDVFLGLPSRMPID